MLKGASLGVRGAMQHKRAFTINDKDTKLTP